MANRFGFMTSNKAGKCMLCRVDLTIGEQCAMDNSCKRRTCVDCANKMISEGHGELPDKVSARATASADGVFYQRMTVALERIADAHSPDATGAPEEAFSFGAELSRMQAKQAELIDIIETMQTTLTQCVTKIVALEEKKSLFNKGQS